MTIHVLEEMDLLIEILQGWSKYSSVSLKRYVDSLIS